ncbi:MAG: cation:proton antiporter [Proteobacteria bacterium]|nr:cation:proton antiporter [Pseudomonadota bacterium]
MEIPLLRDILLIFGLAIAVLFVCHRLRVATIVGFLLTGLLAGPHGFGLIGAVKEVEIFAEIGVVLLLFTIGIEFSLENLLRIKRYVLLGGTLQVGMTILVAFFISRQLGLGPGQSVFVGFLVSLSSTAIVLKLLQERAEVESPQGKLALAILIFQDIIVVPMMLLIPFLAGIKGQTQGSLVLLLIKGIGFILFVLVSTKWIVPQMLYRVARTRSHELFLLSILVICFAVAFLTHSLGLSLALGAFLAGLIISETEFSHETLGNIIPFRAVFTSLFFVSIGMLLDLKFLIQHPAQVALIAFGVMILKGLLAGLTVILLGFPIRTGILAGFGICQVGEFSFILFMKGAEFSLLPAHFYQLFLDVSVLTMAVTPFVIALAPKFADMVLRWPLPRFLTNGFYGQTQKKGARDRKRLRDHLIIIGLGFNGQNMARAAKAGGIPYVIIEMNPQTVRDERKKGEPILYGDASQEAVLEQADVKEARAVVVAIPDPLSCRRITALARKENPKIFIIVRTRFVTEMKRLYELGANQVVPEEFETSIEIFSRVLAKYLIPRDEIERMVAEARAGGYQMFRSLSKEATSLSDLKLQIPDIDITTVRVHEGSPMAGKSIAQVQLRKTYGVTLLAIQREGETISNPDADRIIQANDLLILLATPAQLAGACSLFQDPAGAAASCD